jgi:hypothetical protein
MQRNITAQITPYAVEKLNTGALIVAKIIAGAP